MKLGKRLKDPYTGESLGPDEIDVGVVEIKNRTDRIETARIAFLAVLSSDGAHV